MGKVFQRARSEEEREVRKQKILRSASQLLDMKESSLPSVSQIAEKAGLAKGTIYLYFSTKEEIYISLMGDGFGGWIEQVKAEMKVEKTDIEKILKSYCAFCAENPQIIHLATIAPVILEQNISETIAYECKSYLAREVFEMSELMTRVFKKLKFEEARKLFLSSYALTLGLWMHCHPPVIIEKLFRKKEIETLRMDFQEELYTSLFALWKGYMD